jgi:hypothetical protein
MTLALFEPPACEAPPREALAPGALLLRGFAAAWTTCGACSRRRRGATW